MLLPETDSDNAAYRGLTADDIQGELCHYPPKSGRAKSSSFTRLVKFATAIVKYLAMLLFRILIDRLHIGSRSLFC